MKTIGLVHVMLVTLLVGCPICCSNAFAQKEEIEKIREAGDPVSIADLKPEKVAAEDNAETYLSRVAEAGKLLSVQIEPHILTADFTWRSLLSEDQIEKVEEGFDTYPEVFPMLKKAADCKAYVSSIDYTLKPDEFNATILAPVQDRRNVARLHDYRARYLASIGKHEEAAMMYLQLLRLCRLQRNEPLMISFLVDLAIHSVAVSGLNGILQTSELKQETYAAIEDELARHDSIGNFVHILKTERAFGIETFREMSNPLGFRNRDQRNYLEYMNQQIRAGAKSYYEIDEEIEAPKGGLAAGIVPGLQASREAMNRTRAMMRCVRIVNAIHHRTMQADDVKFEDLRLPKEVGIDPYNGKPLTIQKTEEGWTVYSTGMNGQDDGPILDGITDVGVEPPKSIE